MTAISELFWLYSAIFAASNIAVVPTVASTKTNSFLVDRPGGANVRRANISERPCCGHVDRGKPRPEIPLALILELNQVANVSELFKKFVPHFHYNEVFKLKKTTNDTQVPKAANCATELHTVSLRDDDNPNLYYSPPCTRVKRCGGCCGSNLISCQPIEVEMLNFEVTILEYNGTFTFKEKKIITVEQHVKCKCDCIVKEEDCKSTQVYKANECRCVCNNNEDQDKCYEEQETKFWDSETCSCKCIEDKDCTTGFKFDYNTCGCEPIEN